MGAPPESHPPDRLRCSPADTRRHAHASAIDDPLFECRYPLREWKWDRAACIARIEAAGLPVPPKSSCFICGAIRPDEFERYRPGAFGSLSWSKPARPRVCAPSKASGAGRPRPGPAE
jgi:hypothetical protein